MIVDPVHRENYTRLVNAREVDLTVRNCYLNGCHAMYELTTPVQLDSDNNILASTNIANKLIGVSASTLAAWQAVSDQDADTVVGSLP